MPTQTQTRTRTSTPPSTHHTKQFRPRVIQITSGHPLMKYLDSMDSYTPPPAPKHSTTPPPPKPRTRIRRSQVLSALTGDIEMVSSSASQSKARSTTHHQTKHWDKIENTMEQALGNLAAIQERTNRKYDELYKTMQHQANQTAVDVTRNLTTVVHGVSSMTTDPAQTHSTSESNMSVAAVDVVNSGSSSDPAQTHNTSSSLDENERFLDANTHATPDDGPVDKPVRAAFKKSRYQLRPPKNGVTEFSTTGYERKKIVPTQIDRVLRRKTPRK